MPAINPGASCTQRIKVYDTVSYIPLRGIIDTPSESCFLGAVAGVGFKLITSVVSSQFEFEVGTIQNWLSPRFSVFYLQLRT